VTTWADFMRRAHPRPLPAEVLADLKNAERGRVLADPTCSVCTNWNDGDPACPKHSDTFQEGMICPATGDERHIVIVYQRGAAYACFTCEGMVEAEA
jgi:hypothetical protein